MYDKAKTKWANWYILKFICVNLTNCKKCAVGFQVASNKILITMKYVVSYISSRHHSL